MRNEELSVCIVTYNNSDKISNALGSIIANTKGVDYKLYISDNASCDDTLKIVKENFDNVNIIENGRNIGFGAAHNSCLKKVNSKYHAVVNPDIVLSYDVLSSLCSYLDQHEDTVLVTPKVLFPDGSEQLLPKRRPKFKYLLARRLPIFSKYADEYTMKNENLSSPTEVDFCSGCFFVIRTDAFKKLNGFDERFFMYMEDADLTLRAKQFGKTMFLPEENVIHCWERSSSKSLKYFLIHVSSYLKFLQKHRKTR